MSSGVAVVTGATRGIGLATARAFARRGLDVALVGRYGEALTTAEREIAADHGVATLAIPCDVAKEDDVAYAARAVLDAFGAPRIVVNNAGIVERGAAVHETDVASWDRVLRVNLRGPFLVTRALLPSMLEARRGRIVHVGSISSTIGSPGAASYAASKWGLVGLMKSLAEELRGTGVVTLAVLPGSVDTDMLRGSGFEPKMSADDVARAIEVNALDAPDAIHGSTVELFG